MILLIIENLSWQVANSECNNFHTLIICKFIIFTTSSLKELSLIETQEWVTKNKHV